MNSRALTILSLLVAGIVVAAPIRAGTVATPDGLAPVRSSNLDELYLRPGVNFAAYRKIMVDPVPVTFHPNWLKYSYYPREIVRPVSEDEVTRIAEDTGSTAYESIADAFRTRGYEIVTSAAPGVLRLSPSVADLYVNAPTRSSPYPIKTFTREAGDAMLLLEARDAVTGTLLGRVVHHGRAQQLGRLSRASDVSNRFWFETLLRRWAVNCAVELEAVR